MTNWKKDVEILYDAHAIESRVKELGQQITQDCQGAPLCVVGVLKGSFIFLADLIRHIDLPLSCEFIGISSYGDATTSSGVVQITSDLKQSVSGKNVLVVEDIIDTGLTMAYLLENLRTRRPNQIKVCTLLSKPANNQTEVPIDYTGFVIPNRFVVGYGLDLADTFRNLPFIGVYRGPVDET